MANRSTRGQIVFPARLVSNTGNWQLPAAAEVFVSVQAVEDQADDFAAVPERGGTAMFFMITWAFLDRDGKWESSQLVARDLSGSAEVDLISAWQAELNRLADSLGAKLGDVRLYCWASHEGLLPELNWFPLLHNLIQAEPVSVRGAFGFGLAEITQVLHASGLVDSGLPEQPRDPLAAMAGAWSAAKEAASRQIPLEQTASIQVIGTFSHQACYSMMAILALLRQRADASIPEAA
jgi:hypothetical protein